MSSIRFALRQLAKSPGFTAIATLTLALGMGATITFFSVLYGVVLHNLPFRDSDELVELKYSGNALGSNGGLLAVPELYDYRERQRTLAGIGAYDIGRVTLSLDDGAERVMQFSVTANLLPLLGVQPALGRGFTEAEERVGNDLTVIVSHEFLQMHLGGAADVLNHVVRLNGVEHTIVGVMPAGFSFGEFAPAIWKPLALSPPGSGPRNDRFLSAVARLAPGASLKAAKADLQRVARQLQADLPADYPSEAPWNIELTPMRQGQFGHMLAPLGTLMAAAGAVLLIACVNVAIMFLLRSAVRRRETMIRLALGAARWHIVRQLLAESAVVCALGTAGGWIVAGFGLELLKAFPPAPIPRLQEVAINGPVAAFVIGVLVLVTLAIGLVPATALLRTRVSEGMAQTGRSTETRSAVRLREGLTVIEIGLAVMLLVCGGLAFRSLNQLLQDDLGFETTQLFTFKTNLTPQAYSDLGRVNRFYEQLTARLEALPGVAAVAAVSYLPLSGESQFVSAAPVAASVTPAPADQPPVAWRVVRGPYFSTVGSTLLRGRFFNETDQAEASPVAIVDDEFARRFWPDETAAIGQVVRFGTDANTHTCTIVGVIRRVKHFGPGKESLAEAYVPQAQFYQRGMYTVLRTTVAPASLAPLVRVQLAEIDPNVPMYFSQTMAQRYTTALALPHFTAGLIGAFATLALVLAGVGIFGVTAYAVAQRSREFGIRFALGAQRTHVATLVLARVGRLALLGSVLGAISAYGIAQLMSSLLFGVEPADPPTLAGAAILTALMALTASVAPLLRALRVNPAEALRAE